MVKRIIKFIALLGLAYLLICFVTPFNKYLRNRSIENQISYIDEIMRDGFDDEVQISFPEGKVFSNAIYSLSIIEFCNNNNSFENLYAEIVDRNIERILSSEALRPFNPDMQPTYGIFYNGWSQHVLKSYQKSKLFENSRLKQTIIDESLLIEQRILDVQNDSLSILNSYPRSSWPADNLIALISIENDTLQQKWLEKIFATAAHPSGLINHEGSKKAMIRGSSQALITYCLSEMEYEHVEEYNHSFKNIFIDNFLGIQLVKENEDGSNTEDVDSGPVVFGYGASATIMNIKTQASLNKGRSKATWAAMNSISFPMNMMGKKYYLFKKEPMFDIFMLWGSVALK